MGRVAAIDYGLKRIGIALSDEGRRLASPFTTVEGGKKGAAHVAKALEARKKEIDLILVGHPLLLNGKEGDMGLAARKFSEELEALFGIPVKLWDERLSSAQAERSLKELSLNRKERSAKIDAAAAALLLQSYLDSPS
ncbi:MAG: Holliday junction resolvase RuvX [Verrucomicrobia bacterium]|nr:Holliday junction resolvase RuvX [Verrucomicrobiota bacterium]